MDQIASEAGVGRTTFFRNFRSKEDVVLPDHEPILRAVQARLDSASPATADVALFEASGIVLDHYLKEGEVAWARYDLTRSIPALRAAEIANQRDYQRLFRDQARTWGYDDLDAELLANGVVTAHNYVLRRWLRRQTDVPRTELAAALKRLGRRPADHADDAQVVVLIAQGSLDAVAGAVRSALENTRP